MTYKFHDSILARIVQIVQEGLLLGIDVADIMRQINVQPDETDPHVLVLTPEYKEQVRKNHDKLLEQVEQLKSMPRQLEIQFPEGQ